MSAGRMTLRLIAKDAKGTIVQIYEQDIPATDHAVGLFLRRYPFKSAIATAMLCGGTVAMERRKSA